MAKSYKLLGDGNYVDASGIAYNKQVLSDFLGKGGASHEAGIFFWDGQANSANANNLQLWKDIVAKNATHAVVVLVDNPDYAVTSATYQPKLGGMFFIEKAALSAAGTGTKTIYSALAAPYVGTAAATGSYIKAGQLTATITFSSNAVTAIAKVAVRDAVTSAHYLPTNNTTVTSFAPTHNYHPATKKYVDDLIASLDARIKVLEGTESTIAVDPADTTGMNIWIQTS